MYPIDSEICSTSELAQRPEVIDAVQRMRQKAQSLGYLRSTKQVTVSQGSFVEILPVDPGFIVVPTYDPSWSGLAQTWFMPPSTASSMPEM